MAAVRANRRDHFTPQGYLCGFIHPKRLKHSRPLWVFDVHRRGWSERAPKAIGFEIGYYEYSPDRGPDTTAEDAFLRMENDFPPVRSRIRVGGFATWTEHRELLVSFAGMMAARSPMFRTQAEDRIRASVQGEPERSAALVKNYAITLMRAEIEARRRDWQAWDWALGYTADPENPVVTSDQAVGMWGNSQEQIGASADGDFWVWCPLAWDMCLIDSSKPLAGKRTAELAPQHLAEIRRLTRAQAARFVVSPVRLDEQEGAGRRPRGDNRQDR